MNVLFIGPLPEPVTGQAVACKVLLDELEKTNTVAVVNLSKKGFRQGINSPSRILEVLSVIWRVWRKRKWANASYLTISESRSGNLKDLLIYVACFRRLRSMVIHLHGGAGMRVLLSGKHPVLSRLNEFFLKRLGAIVVLGERHLDMFPASIPRDKIHIVHNFAEDYLFSSPSLIDSKFRDGHRMRILFLSNLLPGKGHHELVQAFKALEHDVRSSVELDFAGGFESDEQKGSFLEMIRGIEQIRYHGMVQGNVKKALFARAHVLCLPSYYPYEGQPISILEAYASGCAVITTDHSGIYDIFVDGVNGYGVEKRSISSLRAAIERAWRDRGRLHSMAAQNLSSAQKRYRTNAYGSKLVDIISRTARVM